LYRSQAKFANGREKLVRRHPPGTSRIPFSKLVR
jgi:hypothetical protein